MARIPSVADGLLQGTVAGGATGLAGLAVGSPAWFAWLAGDDARSFAFRSPAGAYTARKERRQRGGAYWVAYRTAAGRRHKVYLGRAEDLSLEITMFTVGASLTRHGQPWWHSLPFVLVTLVLVGLALIDLLLLGRRAEKLLPRVRDWMTDDSWVIGEAGGRDRLIHR